MSYRYFTLEQRDHLEQAIRDQVRTPVELALALERLRAPDYGTCEVCGAEMPYVEMLQTPGATLCPGCRARRS